MLGATIVIAVVLGALIIAVGVPAILRRRVDTEAPHEIQQKKTPSELPGVSLKGVGLRCVR